MTDKDVQAQANQIRLSIMRVCNQLLTRLSRTVQPDLAARVMLTMSKYMTPSERSGLNLAGYHNTSHPITSESVPEGTIDSLGQPVDVQLYNTFWSLQDVLQNPHTAADSEKWADTLAKIRTCLILLQTCALPKRKVGAPEALKPRQVQDLEQLRKELYQSLAADCGADTHMVKYIRHTIGREDGWVQWKNLGAPSFEKPAEEVARSASANGGPFSPTQGPRTSEGDSDRQLPRKRQRLSMGRAGDKIDNMAGLKSKERREAGALRPLLDEVIMGMDPEEAIEEEYKVNKDPILMWKVLRHVARSHVRLHTSVLQSKNLEDVVHSMFPEDVPAGAKAAKADPTAGTTSNAAKRCQHPSGRRRRQLLGTYRRQYRCRLGRETRSARRQALSPVLRRAESAMQISRSRALCSLQRRPPQSRPYARLFLRPDFHRYVLHQQRK
ncbi:hypothetical protein WJX73_009568 [Symbiochloris irregularis]|uniref:Uncharacterized protein n=1 Tax=Symbiochloris irregularis TaxID=706552 RepID=A0AAW1PJ78_9CHLO